MVTIYAIIAGIGPGDVGKLAPGFVLDAFLLKRRYDMAVRGRLI